MYPTIIDRLAEEATVPRGLTQQSIVGTKVCFLEVIGPALLVEELALTKAG